MMTPRERWLAALQMQPVDRLPFWPKIFASYPRAQVAPFHDMEIEAIHDWVGSDNHVFLWPAPLKEVRKSTSKEILTENGVRRTVFGTRHGSLELVQHWDELSQSYYPVKHPIESVADIHLMIENVRDCRLELDVDALEQQKERAKEIGSKAITADAIGRSPLMNFVEFYARVEDTHYLLHDHPQEMDELLDAMQQQLLQSTEILCEQSVADILYLIEDTSTTLISPTQYRKYCYEHISEHAQIANEAGRHLLLHMCGEMKALLPDVAKLPVAGWEALTSPPVGDTRLPDARTALPDKCLVGGTNAALWTLSGKEIIAELEADLERMPHHRGIVISSAGVLPPECKPETLKQVCDWVQSYSARM